MWNLFAWEFVWGGNLQKIIGGVLRYGLTGFSVKNRVWQPINHAWLLGLQATQGAF